MSTWNERHPEAHAASEAAHRAEQQWLRLREATRQAEADAIIARRTADALVAIAWETDESTRTIRT